MKITGPGQGLPPDAAAAPQEAKVPGGNEFAERLERLEGAGQAGRTEGTAPPGPTAAARTNASAPVGDIALELSAGRLSPAAALDQVIARILARQLGADAPAAVREQVGAALRDALESDPTLADKVRGLSAR